MLRFFVEDNLALAVFCSCALSDQFGMGKGKNQDGSFAFEYLEGQDAVTIEASAF